LKRLRLSCLLLLLLVVGRSNDGDFSFSPSFTTLKGL